MNNTTFNQKKSILSLDILASVSGAFILGAFLFYAAAFASSHTLHNAAHDVRHTIIAPCH